jgi:hypothetical protein
MARLLQRRNIEGRYRLSTTYLITAVLNRSAAQAIEAARVARRPVYRMQNLTHAVHGSLRKI